MAGVAWPLMPASPGCLRLLPPYLLPPCSTHFPHSSLPPLLGVPPAEGIILLDLSQSSWHILYSNDTFRRITGLHNELAGEDGTAPNGAAAADFWRLFSHVTTGSKSSYSVSTCGTGCLVAC